MPKKNKIEKKKEDHIIVEGVVTAEERTHFVVTLGNGNTVRCTIKFKMRQNFIRVLVGDRVQIEISPYDLTRGWITYRYK